MPSSNRAAGEARARRGGAGDGLRGYRGWSRTNHPYACVLRGSNHCRASANGAAQGARYCSVPSAILIFGEEDLNFGLTTTSCEPRRSEGALHGVDLKDARPSERAPGGAPGPDGATGGDAAAGEAIRRSMHPIDNAVYGFQRSLNTRPRRSNGKSGGRSRSTGGKSALRS